MPNPWAKLRSMGVHFHSQSCHREYYEMNVLAAWLDNNALISFVSRWFPLIYLWKSQDLCASSSQGMTSERWHQLLWHRPISPKVTHIAGQNGDRSQGFSLRDQMEPCRMTVMMSLVIRCRHLQSVRNDDEAAIVLGPAVSAQQQSKETFCRLSSE